MRGFERTKLSSQQSASKGFYPLDKMDDWISQISIFDCIIQYFHWLNELKGSFCPFQKNVLLVAVNFHEDHYWMLIIRQSFPTSHFFRFCWKPVPKLIANDQNKGEETMAYWRIGDRGWLWKYLPMSVISANRESGDVVCERRGYSYLNEFQSPGTQWSLSHWSP